jgi:Asp-tRNA(Asn)/Glu-tRNA(Gln) amidotransferase A subunit family amidase
MSIVDEAKPATSRVAIAARASDDLSWTPAWRIAELVRTKAVSPVEVVDHFLGRAEALDSRLKTYAYIDAKGAREAAARAEAAVLRGEAVGALHGVPFAVKDHIQVKGMPFRGGAPAEDDHFGVERLRKAGAILLGGNTMMGEGGGGVMEATGVFKGFNWEAEARNPWDTSKAPGWSSSGGAASVAAGMLPFTLGTDGGGSTRLPAAYSGVVGVHPTGGLIPEVDYTHPKPPAAISTGPLTRDVRDAALVTQIMAGPDGRDPFVIQSDPDDYLAALDSGIAGMKLAWTDNFGFADRYSPPEGPRVIAHVREQAMALNKLGATVAATDEAWEDFWPGRMAQWNAFVQIGVMETLTTAQMRDGFEARGRNWDVFRRLFRDHDLVLSVTTPRVTRTVEEWEAAWTKDGPTFPHGSFVGSYISHTELFNWMKFPAISVPAGFIDGLPVGLQIAGPTGSEARIFRVAQAFQRAFPQTARPPVS